MVSSQPILGRLTDAKQVIDYVKKNGIQIVDLRFVDLLGTVQHFSIPAAELSPAMFELGTGFFVNPVSPEQAAASMRPALEQAGERSGKE